MKRIIIYIAVIAGFGAFDAAAQETMADGLSGWTNEWKHAFSKEGVKEWKPEFTLRYYTGLMTSGPMLTGGVRIDGKRSFALFVGQGDTYLDYAPGDLYSIRAGISFRRYWHLGKRKIFALYSDLYAGAGWIYKINGIYHVNSETGEQRKVIDENVGDMLFVGGWQPGIRIRCYRNLHIFLGPAIATDCLGLHLGVGF